LFFLVYTATSAQINEGAFDDFIYFVNQNRPAYEGIEGTPYLSENFIPARINNYKKEIYIKFNVYANNIELKRPNNDIVILSLEKEYKFKLLDGFNTEYEIHDYINEKGVKSKTFFKKVRTGKNFTLFLKENIKFTPKKLATSGFEQNQPAKFTKSKGTFYVAKLEEDARTLVAVPSRKKELSNFFNGKSKSVLEFIKKERLKLDNKEDLVKLFSFYWPKD
jgi:hypothetical protein